MLHPRDRYARRQVVMAAEELPVPALLATLQVRAARLHSCQHHPASKSSRERMLQDYLFFYLWSFHLSSYVSGITFILLLFADTSPGQDHVTLL